MLCLYLFTAWNRRIGALGHRGPRILQTRRTSVLTDSGFPTTFECRYRSFAASPARRARRRFRSRPRWRFLWKWAAGPAGCWRRCTLAAGRIRKIESGSRTSSRNSAGYCQRPLRRAQARNYIWLSVGHLLQSLR